ncbi:MAG: ATP-binding protein [Pseudomonadota bacterium]
MDTISSSTSLYQRLNNRLQLTGDSEPGQAKLRLFIALVLCLYFCLPWGEDETFTDIINSLPNLIILVASSISLLIFVAILLNPRPSPYRRVCGILLDLVSLSIVMYWTGGDHVPLFVFYLWVTLGNGFRYGTQYLYISFGVSLVGFTAVIFGSEYWREHQAFAISLLIILILLPIYAAFLLNKLHAAIDAAKQANEAKSRFLANMSHELRTPLNGVIGMGELLRETKLNSEQNEIVGTMHSSAHSLLELIENVLDIAKIEAGKINIEHKPMDLYALVNSVIYMLSPMGESKNILVSCSIDPGTPFSLKGDHQHIRQVLINLVNNAIKFTDEGSVNLRVFRHGGTDVKPRIRFQVVDTGVGIPESALATIFDDFTQAESSTSSNFAGTGLGTTISKELVELMGGEIDVTSKVGHGSMFWFELPFEALPYNERIISTNHILLLGNEETANKIRPSLKGWGINYEWVRSSARGLSLLLQAVEQGNNYHSIIIDQTCLIDITAEQFAQMVRAEKALEDLSLILVNSSDTMININSINQYYISTLVTLDDKRALFNAIHAAQSVKVADENIISLKEHYRNLDGASALNILVAEDNSVNQQVIQGILRHAGHQVQITDNGDHVLDLLGEDMRAFDMLILDMNMPGMSGVEVIKAIRFLEKDEPLPIVMLTADATPEAKTASIEAGANAFLTKPVDARSLLERIASLSGTAKEVKTLSPVPKEVAPSAATSARDKTSEWYDETALMTLAELGDFEFIKELIENFKRDGKRHVDNIKTALEDDYLEYRESLHALKGSSIELGAIKLSQCCQGGEALKPYDIGTDRIRGIGNEVEINFNHTIEALDRFLENKLSADFGNSNLKSKD